MAVSFLGDYRLYRCLSESYCKRGASGDLQRNFPSEQTKKINRENAERIKEPREEKAANFENVNSALQAKKLPLKYNQLKLFHNERANYSKMGKRYQRFIEI